MLVPQTLDAARALLAGEDPGLPLAEGYPHADSLDALRMHVEHGGPDDGGWFVTLADGRPGGRRLRHASGRRTPTAGSRSATGSRRRSAGRGLGTEAVGALVDWLVGAAGRPAR